MAVDQIGQCDDHIAGRIGIAGGIKARTAIQRVIARAAVQCVVPAIAVENVHSNVAGDDVIARAAIGIFNQRAQVALILQGVENIAARIMPVTEIGALIQRLCAIDGGIVERPAARRQINRLVRGIIGEIIRVRAATIPDGEENTIATRRPPG